mmetsp:Transcript_7788/g.20091  ORF Transcript_7788/g.20091 Transcript_7788/m.20091 type:complete len:307 (+) Transcript_7788:475-1395(+)
MSRSLISNISARMSSARPSTASSWASPPIIFMRSSFPSQLSSCLSPLARVSCSSAQRAAPLALPPCSAFSLERPSSAATLSSSFRRAIRHLIWSASSNISRSMAMFLDFSRRRRSLRMAAMMLSGPTAAPTASLSSLSWNSSAAAFASALTAAAPAKSSAARAARFLASSASSVAIISLRTGICCLIASAASKSSLAAAWAFSASSSWTSTRRRAITRSSFDVCQAWAASALEVSLPWDKCAMMFASTTSSSLLTPAAATKSSLVSATAFLSSSCRANAAMARPSLIFITNRCASMKSSRIAAFCF